jgi:hypothetical protein
MIFFSGAWGRTCRSQPERTRNWSPTICFRQERKQLGMRAVLGDGAEILRLAEARSSQFGLVPPTGRVWQPLGHCPRRKRGLRPHRGVKPLRGSFTLLVPRFVTALRVSATPPTPFSADGLASKPSFSTGGTAGVRTCNMCRVELPLEHFNFRNRVKGTRNHTCRTCFTDYRQEHYRANRDAYVRRNVRNAKARRAVWTSKLREHLLEHPCVDCGEADPVVLEFDHRDSAQKRREVYWLVHTTARWETVLAEIEQCDVRCANCHRRRTAQQFGWPKLGAPTGVNQHR